MDLSEVDLHGVAQFMTTFFKELPIPLIPLENFEPLAKIVKGETVLQIEIDLIMDVYCPCPHYIINSLV